MQPVQSSRIDTFRDGDLAATSSFRTVLDELARERLGYAHHPATVSVTHEIGPHEALVQQEPPVGRRPGGMV